MRLSLGRDEEEEEECRFGDWNEVTGASIEVTGSEKEVMVVSGRGNETPDYGE